LAVTVHRTHADLRRLFAHVPPNWLCGDASGERRADVGKAAVEEGEEGNATVGVPALPPAPPAGDGSSAADRAVVTAVERCLDTLRRALQIEALLQHQHHVRAIGECWRRTAGIEQLEAQRATARHTSHFSPHSLSNLLWHRA
jgi:hypothetical protein